MPAPVLIGIAGPSCSGKSTLARHLAAALPGAVGSLPLDAYYRDLSHLSPAQRAEVNFDAPDALDAELLARHLRQAAAGQTVEYPQYSFAEHVRLPQTRRLAPGRFLIVEGLFTLYWPEVRRLLDLRVYIEAADALCLTRRSERDVRERGRSPQSVQRQYEATVRPMYEAHIRPTRRYADVQLRGDAPPEQLVQTTLSHLPHPT